LDQLFLEEGNPQKYTGLMPTEKEVLFQLAGGLDFIHSSKGIVHGNIKPENVLLAGSVSDDLILLKWAGFGSISESSTLSFSTSSSFSSFSTSKLERRQVDIFDTGRVFYYYLTGGFYPHQELESPQSNSK
jgi:serine/threonine protein kinase